MCAICNQRWFYRLRGKNLLDELIRQAWNCYRVFEHSPYLVKPSIPILFFGDSERYRASSLKVITVGLNPSKAEFPSHDPFLRFRAAENIDPHVLQVEHYPAYLEALNGYFRNHPYSLWFSSFEPVLQGLDASYYPGQAQAALHTDICSPLATNPTWSGLPHTTREELRTQGIELWHALIEQLKPDLILMSVAWEHMHKIRFASRSDWKTFHQLPTRKDGTPRKKPYDVLLRDLVIGSDKSARLVFGPAATMPFGGITTPDKQHIGRKLKELVYGE